MQSSSLHASNACSSSPHNRIVLLFDLDCFYAQCERVRLGLDKDVSLALLQWNSVLAVTYPARKFGIQRGDNWETVAEKSNHKCWAIHLPIIEKETATGAITSASPTDASKVQVRNPYLKKSEPPPCSDVTSNLDTAAEDTSTIDDNDKHKDEPVLVSTVEEAYNQIYRLSREQQLECQKRERGLRRFHHEGKACLERYRLASMRIFSVVLDSLTKQLDGRNNNFTLERASIDEFYLDVTNYCYQDSTTSSTTTITITDLTHQTVVVSREEQQVSSASLCSDDVHSMALQRACQVSHWIRQDVIETLGFTMSAGISTNKMMAKLAASYGKPNGQAVLYPCHFPFVLQSTKIRKVRQFGGKLGKQVLEILQEQSSNPAAFDGDTATMGELQQVPLPTLHRHFSEETAHFIFEACRGVDGESVKETIGALVKSITAFKSFPATSLTGEIQNWLTVMANEVVTRVAEDSARNHRYPKTCTLNYTYYTTDAGRRPSGVTSTRNFRNSKSFRLSFPREKCNSKIPTLVQQAMQKLQPILKQHALRGVGLSASNFEQRGSPPDGVKGISTFLVKKEDNDNTEGYSKLPLQGGTSKLLAKRRKKPDIQHFFYQQQQQQKQAVENKDVKDLLDESIAQDQGPNKMYEECEESSSRVKKSSTNRHGETETEQISSQFQQANKTLNSKEMHRALTAPERTPDCGNENGIEAKSKQPRHRNSEGQTPELQINKDEVLAKKLQASFDRENHVLSVANRVRPNWGSTGVVVKRNKTTSESVIKGSKSKARRIDSFFGQK